MIRLYEAGMALEGKLLVRRPENCNFIFPPPILVTRIVRSRMYYRRQNALAQLEEREYYGPAPSDGSTSPFVCDDASDVTRLQAIGEMFHHKLSVLRGEFEGALSTLITRAMPRARGRVLTDALDLLHDTR